MLPARIGSKFRAPTRQYHCSFDASIVQIRQMQVRRPCQWSKQCHRRYSRARRQRSHRGFLVVDAWLDFSIGNRRRLQDLLVQWLHRLRWSLSLQLVRSVRFLQRLVGSLRYLVDLYCEEHTQNHCYSAARCKLDIRLHRRYNHR